MPHFIEFKDDGFLCFGFRELSVLTGKVSYPFEDSGGGGCEDFFDGIHGKSVAIQVAGECFLCEGSASVGFLCRPLRVAGFRVSPLFIVDVSIFDEVGVLTSWAVHKRQRLVE